MERWSFAGKIISLAPHSVKRPGDQTYQPKDLGKLLQPPRDFHVVVKGVPVENEDFLIIDEQKVHNNLQRNMDFSMPCRPLLWLGSLLYRVP